ncbi:subtilase-type protease inhibitor [Streptomyces melanogenes]|uniref:Probable subtilase-type protease inhibitor n=1 Tax=Streptomyces melanogenes TaxID=67326 RepID=A0ABZ1XFK1_9ACTN|nr:subtilase-type protease inhibitor [Streptomyces melanogenes]
MRKTLGRTTLVAALALVGAAVAVPGAAGADQHDTRGAAMSLYPPSALVLTVAPGSGDDGASVLRAVTLTCAPTASGTHPAAKRACAELAHNQGDFAAITAGPPQGAVCTKEWNPMTVTADGVWDGQRVSYKHTFGNPCEKQASQGVVFNF